MLINLFLFIYRLCNLGTLLDMGAQFSNLDPAFIMETLTRQIVASFSEAPQLIADIAFFATVDPNNLEGLDFYMAGSAGGRLVKIFFDFTINN